MKPTELDENQRHKQSAACITLIAEIYDSVTRPEGFSPFIEKVCETIGCQSGNMATINIDSGEYISGWQYGHEPDNISFYIKQGLIHKDPLVQATLRSPMGHFVKLRDTVDWHSYTELEIYKNWAAKFNLFDSVGSVLATEGKLSTGIYFQYNAHQQLFKQDDIELLDTLVPHLQRAISLHRRLLEHGISNHPLKEALNLIKSPTILFDRQSRITYINTAAEEFVMLNKWLKINNKILDICSSGLKHKFNQLLDNLVICSFSEEGYKGCVIHADVSNEEKVALCLQPMNASVASEKSGGAVLFIHRQSQTIDDSKVSMVSELFHLTPAEAEVSLLLAQGMSVKFIAEFTKRKQDTVRTHLKSVFAKTGVNSQGQLVSQILTSPVFLA